MDDATAGVAMAMVRDHLAPTPGATGAKSTICLDCGEVFWQWERKYRQRCSRCSAGRSAEAVAGSRHKTGPAWEKVVRGQLRHWLAEAERLGLPPDTR